MKDWFPWVQNKNLKAALDYTMNGGKMDPDQAEEKLDLLTIEGEYLTEKIVGTDFYKQYFPSDRHGSHWKTECPYGVVDHFTAGTQAAGTLKWFSSRARGVGASNSSAHAVIDRNGTIIIVIDPLMHVAWHAPGANSTHVGIEHVNAGLLRKDGEAYFWQNTRQYPKERIPELQEIDGKFWEPYYTQQIVSNVILKRWLIEARPEMMEREHFIDHQQVDPNRKIDCGPLWPLDGINDLVFSREPVREMKWLEKDYLTKEDAKDFKIQVHEMVSKKLVRARQRKLPPGA